MRVPLLGLVLLACSACGSHAATPAASPEPDAAPKSAPVATTRSNGPCLATTSSHAPDGWTASGAIVVAMKDGGHPSQLTVSEGGKTIATETPVNERKISEQIKSLACRANAWIAVPNKGTMTPSEVTFDLYRPAKNDEAADALMLCTLPKEAADPSADESQRAIIAAQLYGERLSSVRYRAWFYDLDRELGAASSDADRVTVKQAHGAKLVALLGASHVPTDRCWFAKVLAAAKP